MLKDQAIIVKDLIDRGGVPWDLHGHDRVYINQEKFVMPSGNVLLDLKYYKTGNISSAYLDGELISNNKAGGCKFDKVFFCKKRGKFFGHELIVDALTVAYSRPQYDGAMSSLKGHAHLYDDALRVYIAALASDGVDLAEAVELIVNYGLTSDNPHMTWDSAGKTPDAHADDVRTLHAVAAQLAPYWEENNAPNSVEA